MIEKEKKEWKEKNIRAREGSISDPPTAWGAFTLCRATTPSCRCHENNECRGADCISTGGC